MEKPQESVVNVNTSPKTHETFRSEEKIERAPDRSVGIVFAVFSALVSLVRFFRDEHWVAWSVAALFFLVVTIAKPTLLRPLGRLWFKFGLVLHHIVSPLILGFLFYGAVFPVAILMRIFGKRSLSLHFEPRSTTYWIVRNPAGPHPESMRHQF